MYAEGTMSLSSTTESWAVEHKQPRLRKIAQRILLGIIVLVVGIVLGVGYLGLIWVAQDHSYQTIAHQAHPTRTVLPVPVRVIIPDR